MSTRLEPMKPRAQAVADALRELVQQQRLVPGDKLPSEAELIAMLGVGRSSVREGIQLLESIGIVKVEHGKGTFLASDAGGGLARVIDWAYAPDDRKRLISDLVEARIAIETAQVRLVAERATDEELAEFQRRFGDSASEAHAQFTASAAETAGLNYHDFLARIAHNDILLMMSNGIRALYESLIEDLNRSTDDLALALSDHVAITEAVLARDADAASSAMQEHMLRNKQMFERSLVDLRD